MSEARTTDGTRSSPLEGYASPEEKRPLAGYSALSAVFGTAFLGGLVAARRAGRPLPELSTKDIVVTGLATQKLSRLLTKEKATSFLRAPFTTYQEAKGYGELDEAARGEGLRRAVGELLICPYCSAQWIAGAFTVGHVAAPRLTRLLTSMWAAHAVADAVQIAYSAAETRA
jgi:hypothetical protein